MFPNYEYLRENANQQFDVITIIVKKIRDRSDLKMKMGVEDLKLIFLIFNF